MIEVGTWHTRKQELRHAVTLNGIATRLAADTIGPIRRCPAAVVALPGCARICGLRK
jgi:hypothetical protein